MAVPFPKHEPLRIGQRFGQLTIVSGGECKLGTSRPIWHCRCDCGSERDVYAYNLRSENSKSCGHDRGKNAGAANRTHGLSRSPEYKIYCQIIDRCDNPNNVSFKNYGGRGIALSPEWRGEAGFLAFLAEVGTRPSRAHTLERKNNEGPYGPGNCGWATVKEQNRNRRNNLIVEVSGRKMCLAEAAELSVVRYDTLWFRIKTGWPIDLAMQTPARSSL